MTGVDDTDRTDDLPPGAWHRAEDRRTRGSASILVVSWNIQFGIEIERASEVLTEHQQLVGADFVLLQEMDRAGTERLADALGYDHVFATLGPHRKTSREFGNAVVSKHPLDTSEMTPLPFTATVGGQERLVIHSDVEIDGETTRVGSVHTEVPTLARNKRAQQQRAVASASGTGLPAIVGGDFNTATRASLASLDAEMAAVGAVRVSGASGPTLRRAGRDFTLDHVYARGFDAVDGGSVDAAGASDHRPIWVRLRPSRPVVRSVHPTVR